MHDFYRIGLNFALSHPSFFPLDGKQVAAKGTQGRVEVLEEIHVAWALKVTGMETEHPPRGGNSIWAKGRQTQAMPCEWQGRVLLQGARTVRLARKVGTGLCAILEILDFIRCV